MSNTDSINKSSYHKGYSNNDNCEIDSGVLILMIVIQNRSKQKNRDMNRVRWGRLISDMCIYSKPKILASSKMKLNDSKGKYFFLCIILPYTRSSVYVDQLFRSIARLMMSDF